MTDKRLLYAALAALTPLAVAVCESDPAALDVDLGPGEGLVAAAMHDSAAVLPDGRTTPTPPDSADYDGTLSGTARVEVYSEAEAWVALGEPAEVSFEIFCQESAMIREAAVVAGTYTRVRVTLTGFVADVAPGATLQGVTHLDGLVITLGPAGGQVVIEKDLPTVEILPGSTTMLVFDLNSEVWLDAEALASGEAVPEEIAAATVVYVR